MIDLKTDHICEVSNQNKFKKMRIEVRGGRCIS